MSHFEKQLSTTLLHKGRIIDLKVDAVELENGHTALREVVVHSGGVGVIAEDRDGCILLVRQFRYPAGRELLEIPAGKLEPGESPYQCGLRELLEETGCRAGVFEKLGELFPTPAYVTERIHLYYARELTSSRQRLDEDEFLTLVRLPLQKAVEQVMDGEILDAKTQVAILKYAALRLSKKWY